ncbi:hypothetical protein BX600DRAFT_508664 [Xylariales sp. PMI_506]|nr:hypothetical protein BX600DRAFT_508664 [Xylariales sp. PMI_506]
MAISQDGPVTTVPIVTNGVAKKPLIVMSAGPATGHTAPTLQIARELINRGLEVVFMTSPEFKESVERIGAEYYETSEFFPPGTLESRELVPVGIPRLLYDLEHVFIAQIVVRAQHTRSLLEMIREREPSRKVVIVAETFSFLSLSFMHGAPPPKGYDKFPKVININVIPVPVTSIDTAPFGPGLVPDSTESGRARNQLLNQLINGGPFAEVSRMSREATIKAGGINAPDKHLFDVWCESYDTFLQLCSPSLDYPRSDLHPSIRYAGTLPKRGIPADYQYPSWFSEVLSNSALPLDDPARKKIVTLSQGTIATDYNEVLLPALKGLASRDDLLVVAILGVKGATLPADFEVPANTRVVDYISYDALLEHADLFITNGGYGGVIHAVNNGVPMVVSGLTEDKTEVCARAEYAGFAINLRTQTPSGEQIATAVAKVLSTPSYKVTAERLRQENEDLNSLSIIEREIYKYAKY